jgi:hypothetical protein
MAHDAARSRALISHVRHRLDRLAVPPQVEISAAGGPPVAIGAERIELNCAVYLLQSLRHLGRMLQRVGVVDEKIGILRIAALSVAEGREAFIEPAGVDIAQAEVSIAARVLGVDFQ